MQIQMKRNAMMFINRFRKTEEGELEKIDDKMVKISRKDFLDSINEDIDNGIEHKIEYVNKKPEEFQMNVIYLLRTPKNRPDYIYTNIVIDT